MNPLKHVAIIMDGNGRWGIKYKNSRNAGHKAGLNTVEKIIKETIKHKIRFLTLYAFSTENWRRPKKEIDFLFSIGGDGTLLRSITHVKNTEVPILGINAGNLGFLTGLQKESIAEGLKDFFQKKYKIINTRCR